MPPTGGINSFPSLGGHQPPTNGKFLVIASASESKNLEKVSAFLIEKTVSSYCGEVEKIKKTRDGKVIVHTKNEKQAKNLMKLTKLGDNTPVAVTEHLSLNKCRVIVSCREVIDEEETVIEEELKSQGVIGVRRLMKKVNGDLRKTAALLLTINSPNEPESIKIAYMNVPTRPYYPRPRRCFKCLKFGHIAVSCTAEQICFRCGEAYHDNNCEKTEKCVNCNTSDHCSTSNKCPQWIDETNIIKVKVDRKISFEEARKIVIDNKKQNFVEAITKSLEEKHQQDIKMRDDRIKNLADTLEDSIKREKIREDETKKIHEKFHALELKFEKCYKLYTEEKAARKRAEQEYESLLKQVETECSQKQKKESQKHRHIREQVPKQNSTEQSPTRKKNRPDQHDAEICANSTTRPNTRNYKDSQGNSHENTRTVLPDSDCESS